jgi:hypothetical protein
VPVFSSERDVYEHIGRLFEEMVADPELVPHFQRADTIVQYRSTGPDASITVDLRQSSEPVVLFGDCELEPEVVMSMQADTAHRFFLGHVNVTVALARGEIKARGPVAKILKLVPLVKPFFPRYLALLEAEGRTDLVTA